MNGMEKKVNDGSVSHVKQCIMYKEDKEVGLQGKVKKQKWQIKHWKIKFWTYKPDIDETICEL